MNPPFILHLCTSYFGSTVFHDQIVSTGKNISIKQTVFCGRKTNLQCINTTKDGIDILGIPIVRKVDSLLFYSRINRQLEYLDDQIDLSEVNLNHAHFLFTDGAMALKINKSHDIPYVVTVRNTDLFVYFKYFKHLNGLAQSILQNAAHVIFVSPAHYLKIDKYLSQPARTSLSKKVSIIPNGIDNVYLNDVSDAKPDRTDKGISLLFVGKIDKNKNCSGLIRLVSKVRQISGRNFTLTVVGESKSDFKQFQLEAEGQEWVTYLGPIYDKKKLKSLYRDHDYLAVLSTRETFGLVYIEAMSQGTPVIYTKGQGIDGYFDDLPIGFAFDSAEWSADRFLSELDTISKQYTVASAACIDAAKAFTWDKTGKTYAEIYSKTLENSPNN